jgi:D-alanine-D-alanine ligase
LLMGGDSGEYEVSIGSGKVVYKSLDKSKYRVFPILVRDSRFTFTDDLGIVFPLDLNDFSLQLANEKINFDFAFIAIHGTPGEDGKLQGYLDLKHIPYSSSSLTTSALTFDKYFCNDLAIQYGINVPLTILLRKNEAVDYAELETKMGYPCFVKPNRSGSSVGVSKAYLRGELEKAIDKAFKIDTEVLVQQFIKGREIACGVFENEEKVVVLPVTEIVSKKDFFDYEAKYTAGMADEITPAPITELQEEECRKMTADLYRRYNCKGVVRFDYFLSDEQWWFLEVNTVPGFSEGSIVPKQAKAAGYTLTEFFGLLIENTVKSRV